jgi:hypothetical protein
MDMVAEQVLQICPNPGSCGISPTFTAVMEGREAREVEPLLFCLLCAPDAWFN